MIDLETFGRESKKRSAQNRKLLNSLKRSDPRQVDADFHALHEDVFAEISCLDCANCCKTTSPIFYPNDIGRAAGALGVRPGAFAEKYLRIDEDGDYVLKSAPCPFLQADNACRIYEARPKACREYPHTDRKKMVQVLDLAYKNSMVCPAVLEILKRMGQASV
jgi:hypothetical protein